MLKLAMTPFTSDLPPALSFELLTFTQLRLIEVPPNLQVKPKTCRYPKELCQA